MSIIIKKILQDIFINFSPWHDMEIMAFVYCFFAHGSHEPRNNCILSVSLQVIIYATISNLSARVLASEIAPCVFKKFSAPIKLLLLLNEARASAILF